MKKIFVSYMHDDRPRVAVVVDRLQSQGFSVWFDTIDLQSTENLDATIRGAIMDGHYIVACLSEHWRKRPSRYMSREVGWAGDKLLLDPLRRSTIVPVLLESCEIPDWFTATALFADAARDMPVAVHGDQAAIDRGISQLVGRLRHIERGYWNTLLAQASDARCHLGLVSREAYAATLKYNALLFDGIQVVATDVLSNRVLSSLLAHEEVAELLLTPRGPEHRSLLRPVSYNDLSFAEIARQMITANTTHGHTTNAALLEHAAFLDSLRPSRLQFSAPAFKSDYHHMLDVGLARLTDRSDGKYRHCTPLREWISTQEPGRFSQSDAWRFIEEHYPATSHSQLKVMTDTGYHTTLARVVGCRLTVAQDAFDATDAMTRRSTPHDIDPGSLFERHAIDAAFSTLDVERLSFSDVAELREGVANRTLRTALTMPAWRRSEESAVGAIRDGMEVFAAEVREIVAQSRRHVKRGLADTPGTTAPVSVRVFVHPDVVDAEPLLVFGEAGVKETIVVPEGRTRAELPQSQAPESGCYAWPRGPEEAIVTELSS